MATTEDVIRNIINDVRAALKTPQGSSVVEWAEATRLNLESAEARAEALEKQLKAVTAERDALKRSLSESLNSGDGVYRP